MTHILQAQNDYADELIEHLLAGEQPKTVKWTYPKTAQTGDTALLYSGEYGIFGAGTILSAPEPADGWGWPGRYGGDVGEMSLLTHFVPLDYLKSEMPDFGWARYPRSYTTLDDATAQLMESTLRSYDRDSLEFEPDSIEPAVEGARRLVYVNAYERSRKARDACKHIHGSACAACGLDFGRVYGPSHKGFIHVHHLRPISEIGEEYVVDPVADLIPVCPNCHAVIHSASPPLTVDEVRELLKTNKEP